MWWGSDGDNHQMLKNEKEGHLTHPFEGKLPGKVPRGLNWVGNIQGIGVLRDENNLRKCTEEWLLEKCPEVYCNWPPKEDGAKIPRKEADNSNLNPEFVKGTTGQREIRLQQDKPSGKCLLRAVFSKAVNNLMGLLIWAERQEKHPDLFPPSTF